MVSGAQRASLIGGAVLLALNRRGLLHAARLPVPQTAGDAREHAAPGTALGVAVLWACDKLVGRLLAAIGSPFPSSVATIFATVGALSAVEIAAGAAAADAALGALTPAVEFLGKWMLVSIAVPLTSIPLSIASGGQWLRLVAITVGGWIFTISSTAMVSKLFLPRPALPAAVVKQQASLMAKAQQWKKLDAERLKGSAPGAPTPTADATAADKAQLAAQRAFSNRSAWNSLTGLAFLALPYVGPAPAQFCTTILSLLHAQRLPRTVVQFGAHPLLLCAGTASAFCAIAGAMRGVSFETSLAMFRTQVEKLSF
jgi:hypothetical protein